MMAQTIDIDNVRYSFSGTSAIVSKYLGGEGTCVIPPQIEYNGLNYSVRKIGRNAFYNSKVTEVKLPETITAIERDAFFWCTNLSKINLPVSLKTLGVSAFNTCEKLTQIIIPENTSFEDPGNVAPVTPFPYCNTLRILIYLGKKAPLNWTATSMTYVPDKASYSTPKYSMNDAHVIEMITFVKTEFDYTGHAPTTTWTNNVEGYEASLSMSALSGEVGSHEKWIPVTFTKGNESFTANVAYRYTIKPVKLTAKVNNASREYGDNNSQFSISYSGFVNGENENVITTAPTVSTTATKTSDVGEYPITISGGSANNYEFTYEPGVLTITKAPLTAKVNDETKQYGKNNPAFTISYAGLKNGETAPKWKEALKIETTATKTSDVGFYDITATGIATNYSLSAINKGILSVTQAPLTIKAGNATRKYFETEPSYTFSCTGFVNDDNVGVLTKVPSFTTDATQTSNVGKYKITPNGAEAKNYAISYEQGELTITKRQLKATSHCSRLYGEENPSLPIEYSGFVNNETENVITTLPLATTTAKKTSSVGEYPIALSGGEATNYEFVYVPGVLTITKASLSAKVKDVTKVYGTQNPTFSILSIDYYGLKNGETIPTWTTAPTFQTEAEKASEVGQYAIKAINGVSVNYELEIADGTLSITPAQLTIKANNATRKYFEAEPSFTYSCTGFVNSDNVGVLTKLPSFTTDAIQTSSVGKYKITPSGAEAKNYAISYEQGELTITKRPLTATSHCSRLYGEENPSLPIEYIGFVNNETENVITTKPIATTGAKKTSSVGEYPITLSGGEATNYDFVYEQGVLEITKASLSAKVNDATKVYGTQNPTFTIDYLGLKNGETAPAWTTRPSFQTKATQSSGVGQYAVKAVNGVPVNYELEIADGILSITPATLTIKANDATRQYYSDNPNFSYTCNGFVNGDDKSVLVPAPNLSTAATLTSKVGTYEIKVGNTTSSNYSISYVNGTLTVTPRTLTASVGDYERTYNEENPSFEVLYDGFVGNDNESVLAAKAVARTSATKKSDVGTYRIDVTGGSADNYTFSYTPGSLTINKAEQTISWEQNLTSLKVGDQVELKAVASSGLPITYMMDNSNAVEIYATGNKSYLDCQAGGQFLIRAVQDGNKNYYSSPRASNTISIIGTNPASDPTLTIKQADNGAVKVQVSKGSVYTFTMAPSDGWQVHSVTYNNSDVTSQLSSDGSFTTPAIDSNSTLSVVYEQQGGNAVNSTKASGVKILATADGVRVIDGDMRDTIYIYTHDGVRQHAVKVDKKIIDIPLSKHDVYIVKVGNKTVKLGF